MVSDQGDDPEALAIVLVTPSFPLGRIVATPNSLELLSSVGVSSTDLLARHALCDWGELDEQDKVANDRALKEGKRLLSSYQVSGTGKVWIITEWDRSATTILTPDEY